MRFMELFLEADLLIILGNKMYDFSKYLNQVKRKSVGKWQLKFVKIVSVVALAQLFFP